MSEDLETVDPARLARAMRALLPNRRILIEKHTILRDKDGAVSVYADADALAELAEAIAAEYNDTENPTAR